MQTYLGTTVSVDDELFGTLCFADSEARADALTEDEKALLELYSQWVGYVLTGWGAGSLTETRVDAIEGRGVSVDAIDSMMEALTSRTRRVVLMSLLGDDATSDLESLERRVDGEHARVKLYHVHLPKLAHFGYVEWDTDAGTISRGPEFAAVEPLVQLLDEYETALPE